MQNIVTYSSYLCTGLFAGAQALIFVLYPQIAEKAGLSIAQVVACFAFGSFLFLWASPYWASRSDLRGRGPILKVGNAGLLLSLLFLIYLMSPLRPNPWLCLGLLAFSRILYGLTASAIVPVAQAMIADRFDGSQRLKALATQSMILNLGRILGPLLGLLLFAVSAESLLGTLAFFCLPLFFLLPKKDLVFSPKPREPFSFSRIWPETDAARSLFLLAMALTALLGIIQSSVGAYLQATFAMSASQASQHMARLLIAAAAATLSAQGLLRRSQVLTAPKAMTYGASILALGALSLLLIRSVPAVYVSVLFMASGIGLLTPSYTAAMTFLYPTAQGQAAGSLSSAHSLGYALGGGLSALGLAWSSRLPLVFVFLLACLVLLLLPVLQSSRAQLFAFAAAFRSTKASGSGR